MPSYLIERYVAVSRGSEVDDASARLAASGGDVRHVHATFVPGDETCFHIVEAASLDAVYEALERAALTYERIVEAIESWPGIAAQKRGEYRST